MASNRGLFLFNRQRRLSRRPCRYCLRAPGAEKGTAVEYAFLKLLEVEIDYRCDVKRDELRNHQPANYNQAQRPARRTISAITQRDRRRAEDGSQRRHQNRPEAIHARIVNCLISSFAVFNSLTCKVDNQDSDASM